MSHCLKEPVPYGFQLRALQAWGISPRRLPGSMGTSCQGATWQLVTYPWDNLPGHQGSQQSPMALSITLVLRELGMRVSHSWALAATSHAALLALRRLVDTSSSVLLVQGQWARVQRGSWEHQLPPEPQCRICSSHQV